MSHRFIDPRPPRPPRPRRGWRASCGILLASITLAGVSVSVASASEPPPAHGAGGPRIDADGNTVLGSSPAVESAAGDPQYIVQLEDGASLDAVVADVADVTGDGVVVADTVEGAIDGFTAALDADGLAALRRHDEVVRVERQQRYELTGIQDNPPWGLDRIDQREPSPDSRYSSRYTGAGVDVYVIDSGIRTTHGEFTGRLKPGAYMDFGDGTGIEDCNGHGTHVAGTVAGTTWGVAKKASIVPVKVFPCSRTTTTGVIVTGINWVIDEHEDGKPAVANLSLGGPASTVIDDAVAQMIADGITVVVSAGNDNLPSCDSSPSRVPDAVTVAASTTTDTRASFSNFGSCNDLFAPGVDIESASITADNGSVKKSGTSMAAPHVAGAAALILQHLPTATPAEVWAAMDADVTRAVIQDEPAGDPDKLLHITPTAVPSEPAGLTGAVFPAPGVKLGEVKLTWSTPADDGGSAITDYVIERSTDGATWTVVDDSVSTALTFKISGLTIGTPYSFRVAAKNIVGTGSWATVAATPAAPPAAPTVTAQVAPADGVGSGEVKLTWNAPSSNGAAISDYVIEWKIGGSFSWTTVDDGISTARVFTVRRLVNGVSWDFRVSAKNSAGLGVWSTTVSAIPRWTPPAPNDLTAQVAPADGLGSGEVELSWVAPSLDGGAVITDYVVEWSTDGTTWTALDDGESTATNFTVDGLTDGTPYSFRVAARNLVGVGSWSDPIQATPRWTPAVPSGLRAAVAPADGVGSGEVKLTWTAPADGGSAITDFVIARSVDGTTWTTVSDGVSTATTFTVGGLTNGIEHSFRIAAVNELGVGGWSATATATSQWSPPAPGGLTATASPAAGLGSGEVQLTWTTPADDGGTAITDYLIEWSVDGSSWSSADSGGSTATEFTVGGLANGTRYRFRVAAANRVGVGPWSVAAEATPVWMPAAPSGLLAAAAPTPGVGSGQLKLTWSAPPSNGEAITGYVVQRSIDGTTWTTVSSGGSTATTFTAGGLRNGTPYRFRVAAKNAVGIGPWSATAIATPKWKPAAPSGLRAAAAAAPGVSSGQVKLAWNAPSANGGGITDYVIRRSVDGTTWTTVGDGVSTAKTFTVGGLRNGTPYRFQVAAKNAVGVGLWSATVTATPKWKPAAPSGLRAAVAPAAGVGSRQVKLTWTAPSSNGSAISDYIIQRSASGKRWTTVSDGISTARSRLVARLSNGTVYRFRVAARNAVGVGAWSAVIRASPRDR